MDFFHIDSKKFYIRRLLTMMIFMCLYILFVELFGIKTKNLWWIIGIVVSAYIGYKIPYMGLISKRNKQILIRQYMFPNFLRYFISLLSTKGNVYQTIKETLNYIDEPFKELVEKLVVELEDDNIPDYKAFMNFAYEVNTSEAFMIMNMINDFNEQGINKNELSELENIILRLQENKVNSLIEKKVNKMGIYADPILIMSIVYMLIFVGVVFVSYMNQMNSL